MIHIFNSTCVPFHYRGLVVEFHAILVTLLEVEVEISVTSGQPGIVVSAGVSELVHFAVSRVFSRRRKSHVGDRGTVVVEEVSDVLGDFHTIPVSSHFSENIFFVISIYSR